MLTSSIISTLRINIKIIKNTSQKQTLSFSMQRLSRYFSSLSNKLIVNFVTPHSTILSQHAVDQVNIATQRGDRGILPNHTPIIEQLRPGVVEILNTQSVPMRNRYFVSGGFAVVHSDSRLDISAIEAVPTDHISPMAVAKGLEEVERRVASSEDAELARAEIELETYQAMSKALESQ